MVHFPPSMSIPGSHLRYLNAPLHFSSSPLCILHFPLALFVSTPHFNSLSLKEYFGRLLMISFLISLLLPLGLGGASDFTTYQSTAGFIALGICVLCLIIGLIMVVRKRSRERGKAFLWNSLMMLVLSFSLVSTAQSF